MITLLMILGLFIVVFGGSNVVANAIGRKNDRDFVRMIEAARAEEAAAAIEEPCWQQAQRDLEWRHVSAGILKDYEMTTCEDMECPDCKVTRQLKHDQELYGDGPRPITWRLK